MQSRSPICKWGEHPSQKLSHTSFVPIRVTTGAAFILYEKGVRHESQVQRDWMTSTSGPSKAEGKQSLNECCFPTLPAAECLSMDYALFALSLTELAAYGTIKGLTNSEREAFAPHSASLWILDQIYTVEMQHVTLAWAYMLTTHARIFK